MSVISSTRFTPRATTVYSSSRVLDERTDKNRAYGWIVVLGASAVLWAAIIGGVVGAASIFN